ncbi:MAG TPA: hypothetical protein VJ698_03615 [Noviherbaspirillum sp.]|uniref:hypothetical protein n=1 Tax=Noviherbaspirillum sp. TaxID=1926288 RepID=UPI002B494825|nr:hypothetical protein [Noviherbaspirillum sp.]HJV84538.1 hypothetical protein [Noviherbaspirillum sp.]
MNDEYSESDSLLEAISREMANSENQCLPARPPWQGTGAGPSLDHLLEQLRKALQNASGVDGQIATLRQYGLLLLLEADELQARCPADFHTSFDTH